MPTFGPNGKHLHGHNSMWRVCNDLSLADYLVLETHTGKGERPSIRINRPFEGQPHQVVNHGGKLLGSTEYLGCRLYWDMPANAEAAA